MEPDEALKFINNLLEQKNNRVLGNLEKEIFSGCWSGQTYAKISETSNCTEEHLRETGAKLFKKLKSVLGIEINKNNFKSSIEHKYQENRLPIIETTIQTSSHVTTTTQNEISSNLDKNPFIPLSGKIVDEKLFFPRPIELKQIFQHLNGGGNVALIGKEGVGKSSLLWAIGHHSFTQLNESRQAVFLDLNEISDSENEFYGALCHEIGIPDCRGNKLNRELRDKRILLAIDNAGKLAREGFTRELRDWLRSKAEGIQASIRLVLAANSPLEDLFQDSQNTSPLAGICQTEKIDAWSPETIRSFISARLQNTNVKNFEESKILEIIELSSGHPKQLMKLCNQTYEDYQRLR
ncbi:MAG: ATP-binding protein [Hassallia sp. WJT32-NPBG1]|jgi:GTPase SAR1 family protein|nr:ATP-binding protein [Hassallia sp. WJT32-NPBG1]